jgi:hypothetical protein
MERLTGEWAWGVDAASKMESAVIVLFSFFQIGYTLVPITATQSEIVDEVASRKKRCDGDVFIC